MWGFVRTTFHVARKDYRCDAWQWVCESVDYFKEELTPSEKLLVKNAKETGGVIKKGQLYLKLTGVYDGDWTTFRANPEMEELAQKYDVYQC